MTKSNKGILLGLTLITIVLTTTVQTGCNTVDEAYLSRLDTLDYKLNQTEQYLSIDFATIDNRAESIDRELRYMAKYYDKTYSESLGNNLTKYKGIKKNYAHFVKEYPKLFNEMKSLQKQAKDLRISVSNGTVSKEKFKSFYQTELSDTEANRKYAEKLSLSIHALEPEYQRISTIVQQELQRIAKVDTVFNNVLKRDSAVNNQ